MPMMLILVGAYVLFRNWNGDVVPLLVIGGVAVVGVLAYRAYQSRQERIRAEKIERADASALTEQVESLLAETANRILDVEDRPGLIVSEEANEYFQRAVSTFVSVDEKLEDATATYQLRRLVSDLEDALWRLDAAQAVMDGEPVPPKRGSTGVPSSRSGSSSGAGAMTTSSREVVSRWVDDRGDHGDGHGHRRRKRRSC